FLPLCCSFSLSATWLRASPRAPSRTEHLTTAFHQALKDTHALHNRPPLRRQRDPVFGARILARYLPGGRTPHPSRPPPSGLAPERHARRTLPRTRARRRARRNGDRGDSGSAALEA